ncbi:hypothetical protein ACQKD6_04810 [Bacillus cereus]|nr:hypothetical protein [Bacillus cereus]
MRIGTSVLRIHARHSSYGMNIAMEHLVALNTVSPANQIPQMVSKLLKS